MKSSAKMFYSIVAALFILDAIYFYGYDEDIVLVVKWSLLFLGISLLGFILLIFVDKEKIENKFLPSVMITIGIITNLVLIVTWYIFKDFGF